MKLSIIVPCKNEEDNVEELYSKINEVLNKIKYEIIFIDDGSSDKTFERLSDLFEKDIKHVKVLSFSRNFKKDAAIHAGLVHASGEYTCILDGDLQQNPKYLLDMIDFLNNNKEYDEVAMVMKNRTVDSFLMKVCKGIFYKLIDSLSDVHFENAASDFRMFRKNVREAVISLSEKSRFSKGIFAWVGFRVKYLPYDVEPRRKGKTSFNFSSSLKYAIDGILSFSFKPLKISINCGILTLLSFLIYLIVLLVRIIGFNFEFTIGHAIILLMLFLFGIQFLLLGIIGEYIGKINGEVKNRPVYIIREKLGFNTETIL
ncbi:MAG: glycosyltransferase [Bacilli bacterium]|nr:glycosyltransferase [Bacilli bacterium]